MENFNITEFLKKAVGSGASDIHLRVGEHPAIRVNGKILKIDTPALSEQDIASVCEALMPERFCGKDYSDLDFAYEVAGVSRFRVNLSRQMGKNALVIRTIPYNIKKISELNLPEAVEQFSNLNNGLVVVTGPTGSGKSTTIASLIDSVNINYNKHIITIEDPVEFIFTSKKSVVSQRQVLLDTAGFPEGIKYALRQDPDVIFIGEIRDTETAVSALKAAETGHLVFATVHTNDAVQTVNRIVNMFAPADRAFMRNQVAQVLRGTISQKLVPLANGSGRYPACEVLVVTPTVKDFIEKDNLSDIYGLVQKGSFNNMITMNASLYRLYDAGLITAETAAEYSDNKNELQQMLRGVYHGTFGGQS
ncbi:MAG: PilT/PilU family type 4a pilus ATPase [Heliobacteriaceae bacterium]|jgi:twitching motility protein PilT|nr:PilT/PilU family type 4a pilus ATPase [Heliobacteriaceae bacterium]